MAQFAEAWIARKCRLVNDSGFSNIDDLLADFDSQYERMVSSRDMLVSLLEDWCDVQNRDFRRKLLLVYQQGLVCNRCDQVVLCGNQLRVDHIWPRKLGGQTKLVNLQLLCEPCNGIKGDSNPSETDISPFLHQGPACVHQITCVERQKPQIS